MTKKLIVLGVVIFFLGLIVYILRPTVEVTVESDREVSAIQVRINNTLVGPSGKDGRTYRTRVLPGSHKITVKGQEIKTVEQSVTSFVGKTSLAFKPDTAQMEQIVKDIASDPQIVVSNIGYFEEKWIVAYIQNASTKNKDDTNEYPVILRYDLSTSEWELGSTDNTEWILDMPGEARRLYASLSDD